MGRVCIAFHAMKGGKGEGQMHLIFHGGFENPFFDKPLKREHNPILRISMILFHVMAS